LTRYVATKVPEISGKLCESVDGPYIEIEFAGQRVRVRAEPNIIRAVQKSPVLGKLKDEESPEMAVRSSIVTILSETPGFTAHPSLMSLRNERDELFGLCSRIKYGKSTKIVMAKHSYLLMKASGGKVSLENRGRVHLMSPEDFVPILGTTVGDVQIVSIPDHILAALQVRAMKTRMVKGNPTVRVYGFDPLGRFFVSTGQMTGSSTVFRNNHTCTTYPGCSGSPLIVDQTIVGVHCAALKQKGVNIATSCFWARDEITNESWTTEGDWTEDFNLDWKASDDDKNFDLELYGATERRSTYVYNSKRKAFTLPPDNADSWSNLEEMDFSVIPTFEDAIPVEKPKVSFVETPEIVVIKPEDFPQVPSPTLKDTVNSDNTSSIQKKKRTRKRLSKSAPAPLALGVDDAKLLLTLRKLLREHPDEILQSSIGLLQEALPSCDPSSIIPAGPVNQSVIMVHFTRKQLRLYNRITHQRCYQSYLRNANSLQAWQLRSCTLEFVLSSPNSYRETPTPEFLLGC